MNTTICCGLHRRWYLKISIVVITMLTTFAMIGVNAVSSNTAAQAVPLNTGVTITAQFFGIHAISNTKPALSSGTYRMALLPSWKEVETSRGHYNWTKFDGIVQLIQTWGFHDILYAFGATPVWAGTPRPGPGSPEANGLGAASPPDNMAYFDEYVAAVAKRYKGRITAYEAWNEPTSPQFFRGSPAEMANMTGHVYNVVKRVDPAAKVTSGSVQTHSSYYGSFAVPYFGELAKRGWPVDVMSGHFYPKANTYSDGRYAQLVMMRNDLTKLGLPANKELWDTETNMAPATTKKYIPEEESAAITRTYLDTLRAGYSRSYWYMYTDYYLAFLKIQMQPGNISTKTLQRLQKKIIGATFNGCTTIGVFVSCGFTKNGENFAYSWANTGTSRAKLSYPQQVCSTYTTLCQQRSNETLLTGTPVLTPERLTPVPTLPGIPGTPTVAAAGGGVAKLNFSPPAQQTYPLTSGYRVDVLDSRNPVWRTVIPNTKTTSLTATVSGLNSISTYRFRVAAINAFGNSIPSEISNAIILQTPPWEVRSLNVRYPNTTQTVAYWLPPVNNGGFPVAYWVRISTPNSAINFTSWVSTTSPSRLYSGLQYGKTYRVEVHAYNKLGLSPKTGYSFTPR